MKRKYLDRAFEFKAEGDKGVFTGYGSVFGKIDSHRDIVMPGAFKESLREDFSAKNRKVPILWQHDSWNPIGVYEEIREDDTGLFVKGQLNLEVQQGRECHSLMKQGALSGLSIGYNTREYSWDEEQEIRSLLKVRLWEVSPVTFPSGDEARVESVKGMEDLLTLSDIEAHLRDAYGMSRKEATGIIARIKAVPLPGDPAEAERKAALQGALKQLRSFSLID